MDIPTKAPDGILMGFIADPFNGGKQHHLAMVGSAAELVKVCKILCLKPNPAQVTAVQEGSFDRNDGPLEFTDEHGTYVTMQPVVKASDFFAFALERSIMDGDDPTPFL